MDQNTTEAYLNNKGKGSIKIWAVNKRTGKKYLLVDRPNTILNQGADILAKALAGTANAAISHMYVGYNNTADDTFTRPVIDKTYSVSFTNYGLGDYAAFGYLRIPLAYSPSFIGQTDYVNNVSVFTTVLSSAGSPQGSSAPFRSTADVGTSSQIFEVGLISAFDTTSSAQDKVFSRANFVPLLYDPNFNLTITWGVQFSA